MNKIIEVKNINKSINGKKILHNISFDAYEGEIIGLVGKNGSGKSTLLKIMTGLYKSDSGEIFYNGINLDSQKEKALEHVGCLIESPDMYKNLSGKSNLELFKTMLKGIDENKVNEIVKIVEMEKNLGKKYKMYSLGMKEKLGIIVSLLNNPKILILDEPTNGLDPIGINKLRNLLKSLNNTTIIISSHMLNEIKNLCDKVIFMNNGKILSIKNINNNENKKRITFEVDDYSRAKLLMKPYYVNDNLEVYESDEIISDINRDLVKNDINVYRIFESKKDLEKDFLSMVDNND